MSALPLPSTAAVPEGFVPLEPEAFMETVGPVYMRQDAQGVWELGCRALPRHANRFDSVHGGMLATLVDYAVGINLLKDGAPGLRLGTVSLNIDFISAGRVGEWLLAQVRMEKKHGRLRFCSCTLQGDDGRLILKGNAVLSATSPAP